MGAIRTEQRRAQREGNTQLANTLGAELANERIRRASQGESAIGSADSDIREIIPAGTIEADRIKRQAAQAANMGAGSGAGAGAGAGSIREGDSEYGA